jgi:hypothetical protein
LASKEDILEQLVEEFLIHRGYFVRHNVKFLPKKDHADFVSNQDSNHSDIDVLAFSPTEKGADRVWAVSCKSWQAGFDPAAKIKEIEQKKKAGGREAWKGFRELVSPKWSEAFITAVEKATGESRFTYVTAVTKLRLRGDRQKWEKHPPFCKAMAGNPIKVVTLNEMLTEVSDKLSRTLAGTELGRTLQLFRAAGFPMKADPQAR